MLFVPPLLDLDGEGTWTRDELKRMNQEFTAAVERAFGLGLESRTTAAAMVSFRNDSRRLADDAAIGAVWSWFVGVKFEATAVEVLARVRACYSSVTAEQVRVEFRRRLFSTVNSGLIKSRA